MLITITFISPLLIYINISILLLQIMNKFNILYHPVYIFPLATKKNTKKKKNANKILKFLDDAHRYGT